MNHVQLHNELCQVFKKLKAGRIETKKAKELFNGAGKIIQNCRNEIVVAGMGVPIEIPLMGISKEDSKKLSSGKPAHMPLPEHA